MPVRLPHLPDADNATSRMLANMAAGYTDYVTTEAFAAANAARSLPATVPRGSPRHTAGHHGVQISARLTSQCLGAGAAHAAHWPRA